MCVHEIAIAPRERMAGALREGYSRNRLIAVYPSSIPFMAAPASDSHEHSTLITGGLISAKLSRVLAVYVAFPLLAEIPLLTHFHLRFRGF